MGVYNNNKDGTRSTLANTIQVVDAPMEQFLSRGEFSAVTPNDVSADNKLVAENEVTKAVDTMPTASASLVGTIVQYVGTTTANYINGYFYKCVSDGAITPTYSWVEVISGGGGSGDMLASIYDPDGNVAEAGGIEEYIKDNAPRYNVLDYGLVGDGVTDNTEALTDMIADVPEGSVIYFPQGTYNISDTIEVNKSMSFIGDTIHNQIHNFETPLSDSIINYSGSKTNVTLFERTNWRGVFFKGLTFKGNAFTCTVNPNRSEVIPKPIRVDNVIIEGISAIDLHTPDAWTTISDCLFYGFSGFGVKIGQHKYVINCGFHSCNDAIQAGFDSFVENSWICCCHNAIRSVKTEHQIENPAEATYTSIGVSDTWADQLSGHFYVADWELGSVTCIMDNIVVDLVDESAFYMPLGQLVGGRIQGYINRYGMACEGIEESEKTAELLPKSCCIYAYRGGPIDLNITTVDTNTLNDARKLIECSGNLLMAPITISCPNRPFNTIFGANCSFQHGKKDGYNIYSKEGHSIYYQQFWYTNGRTSFQWGALHNMLAPAIGVYCLDTRKNIWHMSTKADDREAWIPVEAPSLSTLTDVSLTTPAAGDVLVYDGSKWENAVFDGFEREKVYTPVELTYDDGEYIQINTGVIAPHTSYQMAEVSVTPGDKYRVAGTYNTLCALYAFYDSNGNVIVTYPTTQTAEATMEAIDILVPNNAATLKISGIKLNGRLLLLYKATDGNAYKLLPINDILYGKKWFACGDSFTKGDFSGYVDSDGKTMYESDAFDRIDEKWKTYSYWISKRTHINSDNDTCARGGMLFTNVTGAINPFSSDSSSINYTMIPSDCDYITLQFGLNEQSLTTEQIGTSADTTNETLWGAYYVVLNSILTNNPSVKIGIIISDGHMNQRYHDALIDIAKYWGIPYLDLKNGELVPMMNLGRLDACSEVAKNLRDSAFAISASNQHPTPVGHEYRSTVIENFLRSL